MTTTVTFTGEQVALVLAALDNYAAWWKEQAYAADKRDMPDRAVEHRATEQEIRDLYHWFAKETRP